MRPAASHSHSLISFSARNVGSKVQVEAGNWRDLSFECARVLKSCLGNLDLGEIR